VTDVFERFTDRARRVLVLAQDEARQLGHNFIGTEHILLGLLCEGEAVAAKALESIGIGLETARARVAELDGPFSEASHGSMAFTPRAKKVLELSLREANELGHSYIGTEHLLLGLIREGDGVGAQVLISMGADAERIRGRVIQLLSGHELSEPIHVATTRSEDSPGAQMLAVQVPSATPPDCPHCRSSLTTAARVRRLTLAETDGEPGHVFLIVYCDGCGRALAFRPPD
jgi:ATP-dependent Clp protease ATP-binding subunit ClpC